MQILFPSEPLGTDLDSAFADERAAAEQAGLQTRVLGQSLKPGPALYRGWMLMAAEYEKLHADLASRGVDLITSPAAYRTAHHLPEVYPYLEPQTPQSLWFPADAIASDRACISLELVKTFGASPLVIKDYVKSEKGYWNEACFIPHADDSEGVWRVVDRFLELRGPYLNEGVVFRRFLTLDTRTRERRIFWFDGHPLFELPEPPARYQAARFQGLARLLPCRFFTMDVALVLDGSYWTVIECGDGQVSGLPAGSETAFYRELASRFP